MIREKSTETAWVIPIQQLNDLWLVRFGNRWVRNDEIDAFYYVACCRLLENDELERHSFPNTYEPVYRLRNNICK